MVGALERGFARSLEFVERVHQRGPTGEIPEVPQLQAVCSTLWARKGKRLRSRLVYWLGELCEVERVRLEPYAWAAEAIHTASLLHDDVVDSSHLRRGEPSANALFDNTLPVLSGDYLFSDAILQVAKAGNGPLLQRLCETVKALAQGECLQYGNRFRIPKDSSPFARIAELKTSSLLVWAGVVGPHLNPRVEPSQVAPFLLAYGRLFQFTDDLLDAVGTETKPQGNDLQEGKLNEVVWSLVQRHSNLKRHIERDFSRRQIAPETLRLAHHLAQRDLAPERQHAQALAEGALGHLQRLPSGECRDTLGELTRLTLDRLL